VGNCLLYQGTNSPSQKEFSFLLIKTIEKAIAKNRVPENDKELGKLISLVIMWRLTGVFSRIRSLIEGKEDAFMEIARKID
jgi:hypothetical protein